MDTKYKLIKLTEFYVPSFLDWFLAYKSFMGSESNCLNRTYVLYYLVLFFFIQNTPFSSDFFMFLFFFNHIPISISILQSDLTIEIINAKLSEYFLLKSQFYEFQRLSVYYKWRSLALFITPIFIHLQNSIFYCARVYLTYQHVYVYKLFLSQLFRKYAS